LPYRAKQCAIFGQQNDTTDFGPLNSLVWP
jgi:hypothetical protein